jgi:hypothetical protein
MAYDEDLADRARAVLPAADCRLNHRHPPPAGRRWHLGTMGSVRDESGGAEALVWLVPR